MLCIYVVDLNVVLEYQPKYVKYIFGIFLLVFMLLFTEYLTKYLLQHCTEEGSAFNGDKTVHYYKLYQMLEFQYSVCLLHGVWTGYIVAWL